MPVFINNVDDYLGPSQACVNPLFTAPAKSTQPSTATDANLVNVTKAEEKLIPSTNDNEKAKVVAENNVDTSQKVVQSRRRTRQRRVPRIIQSEESGSPVAPNTGAGEVIRLALAGGKDSKEESNEINAATTQTIKKKATVTLSDCLSCSGCVTSAEAVLMSEHSIDKLREVSHSQHEQQKRIVFSISSASLADIYRHLYLEGGENAIINGSGGSFESLVEEAAGDNKDSPSRHEFLAKIAAFLHSEFGAEMLVDGALSQKISLMESASEFCYRYRKTRQSREDDKEEVSADSLALTSKKQSVSAMPSVALSSTKTRYINQSNGDMDEDTLMEVTTLSHPPGRLLEEDRNKSTLTSKKMISSPVQPTSLPMLASSCPGFVCLVEKTAPSVVTLLSSAKSPMAIAGVLLKTGLDNKNDSHSNHTVTFDSGMDVARSCYHVAIMPCHDKKLEAGRMDFSWEQQALLRYGNSSKPVNKGTVVTSKTSISVDGVNDQESEDLVNEVDLVLTTGELLEILSDAAAKQKSEEAPTLTAHLPDASENGSSTTTAVRTVLARKELVHGSCALKIEENGSSLNGNEKMGALELDTGVHGSGSYADFIFRYAAYDLFGCTLPLDNPLPWKSSSSTYTATSTAGKTAGVIRRRRRRQETTDLREITLYKHSDGSYSCCNKTNGDIDHSSTPVLRFATAYGFKNVQLILQSLSKTESSSKTNGYDYVEVMACPSGCSNGGGQIGANGQRETPRETKERVRKTVSAVPIVRPTDKCTSLATTLCGCDTQGLVHDSILQSESFGENARQLFHTRFHVVPKLELSTGATAGVALSDTKW
mmetsp:Transcript_21449/g.46595  ORF Transcript_21449/g.46595 Transcript_21449/m.46595 type:complete len:824 (+) Transcript_21449:108-2579(+)